MNRDESYLLDIYQHAMDAQSFVKGMDSDAFELDDKTQAAVLFKITILGEAVKQLSPEFRTTHPTIEWKHIAGTRDKLIHEYRRIDTPKIWHVLQVNIPELLAYIKPLLPRE